MGTCGLFVEKSGRFYPSGQTSGTVGRLHFYSRHFPCLEVDTSTYAIPEVETVRTWCKATPKGFRFHFKVFGMLTARGGNVANLPTTIRKSLPPGVQKKQWLTLHDLGEDLLGQLWETFNKALRPANDGCRTTKNAQLPYSVHTIHAIHYSCHTCHTIKPCIPC